MQQARTEIGIVWWTKLYSLVHWIYYMRILGDPSFWEILPLVVSVSELRLVVCGKLGESRSRVGRSEGRSAGGARRGRIWVHCTWVHILTHSFSCATPSQEKKEKTSFHTLCIHDKSSVAAHLYFIFSQLIICYWWGADCVAQKD